MRLRQQSGSETGADGEWCLHRATRQRPFVSHVRAANRIADHFWQNMSVKRRCVAQARLKTRPSPPRCSAIRETPGRQTGFQAALPGSTGQQLNAGKGEYRLHHLHGPHSRRRYESACHLRAASAAPACSRTSRTVSMLPVIARYTMSAVFESALETGRRDVSLRVCALRHARASPGRQRNVWSCRTARRHLGTCPGYQGVG